GRSCENRVVGHVFFDRGADSDLRRFRGSGRRGRRATRQNACEGKNDPQSNREESFTVHGWHLEFCRRARNLAPMDRISFPLFGNAGRDPESYPTKATCVQCRRPLSRSLTRKRMRRWRDPSMRPRTVSSPADTKSTKETAVSSRFASLPSSPKIGHIV